MTVISTIETMDGLSVLGEEVVHNLDIENHSIYEILTTLFSHQLRTPTITIGYIDPEYAHKMRSVHVSSDTILRIILQLVETTGGYVFVDTEHRFHWIKTIGENKGQQIRYRKNMAGIIRDIDFSSICNRVYVYGQGSGPERIKLTNGDHPTEYIDDLESQERWGGIYARVFSDRRITHPETLFDWGMKLLDEFKNPKISYTINTINLAVDDEMNFEALQLGSVVRVIDEDIGIDVELDVISIKYHDIQNDPYSMEIQLSSKLGDITDSIAGVYDSQQLYDAIPTEVSAGHVVVRGDFTVLDWVTRGQTSISGDSITTGTITADQLIKTQALITDTAQIGAAVIESASIKSLDAKKIVGELLEAQIGIIDGAKIRDASITNAKITELDADKIRGQLINAQVAEIDWAKIRGVEIKNADIVNLSADKITGEIINAQIANLDGAKIVDGTITNAKIQSLEANKITGKVIDTQIANIKWAQIEGVEITNADIINVSAEKITGEILNAQIANLHGAKIVDGTITDAKIHNLQAHKIQGQIVNAQVAEIDWAKIRNVEITEAQIESISASKITYGTLNSSIELGSGQIYAGGTTIDHNGITVDGQAGAYYIRFKYGSSNSWIYGGPGGSLVFQGSKVECWSELDVSSGLLSCSRGHLVINPSQGYDIQIGYGTRAITPQSTSTYLGTNYDRFKAVYARNIIVSSDPEPYEGCIGFYTSGSRGAIRLYAGGRWWTFLND